MRKVMRLFIICALGLATAALSVLLIVNAGMNGYSPYGAGAANKLDAAAEYSAATMMPKISDIGVEVKRSSTLNFGEYSAYMYYTTVHSDRNQAVQTDASPGFISQFYFRGDKYLAKNTKAGGAPVEFASFAAGSVYREGNFIQTYSSYKEDETLYYAAFYLRDPDGNTLRTIPEVTSRYVDADGNKLVTFVGYKTLEKADDVVLGVYTDKKTFLNPFNSSYSDGEHLDILNVILRFQSQDAAAVKLLEELNFFGKGVKLNLSGRREYVESQDGKPPVLMLGVVATGKEIRYMEAAYPEIKLFEAVEKVR